MTHQNESPVTSVVTHRNRRYGPPPSSLLSSSSSPESSYSSRLCLYLCVTDVKLRAFAVASSLYRAPSTSFFEVGRAELQDEPHLLERLVALVALVVQDLYEGGKLKNERPHRRDPAGAAALRVPVEIRAAHGRSVATLVLLHRHLHPFWPFFPFSLFWRAGTAIDAQQTQVWKGRRHCRLRGRPPPSERYEATRSYLGSRRVKAGHRSKAGQPRARAASTYEDPSVQL